MRTWKDSRRVSAAELVLGAAIVIGHNVFRVLPNEVPILFVLGLASLRLRDGGLSAMGFRRPPSWTRIVLIALAAAVLRILLGELLVNPLTGLIWPPAKSPSGGASIAGDPVQALKWLGIVWTFAAFGEEISYRGYLLVRAADLGGRRMAAYWIGVVVVSVLFGYGHYYKGPAGIVDSAMAGLVLGVAFMLSGRNLWTCILAHGFIDTIAVATEYFGQVT